MTSIENAFFKCIRWQLEETTDLISCPYHYFCASIYPGDYPPIIDFFVFLFIVFLFLTTAAFSILDFRRRISSFSDLTRRFLSPSGPLALPLIVLILANGSRINTIFSLSQMGPALLQLVHISTLVFRNRSDKDINYAVLEASTASGILHASLYLDSIILPYYTGLEALSGSAFSGACVSCVCRREELTVGGRMVAYRGWSITTFSIITVLCLRVLCRIVGEKRLCLFIKLMLEGASWMFITSDSIGLVTSSLHDGVFSRAMYVGLLLLILLNVVKVVYSLFPWFVQRHHIEKKLNLYQIV